MLVTVNVARDTMGGELVALFVVASGRARELFRHSFPSDDRRVLASPEMDFGDLMIRIATPRAGDRDSCGFGEMAMSAMPHLYSPFSKLSGGEHRRVSLKYQCGLDDYFAKRGDPDRWRRICDVGLGCPSKQRRAKLPSGSSLPIRHAMA
jgi:hypothetical protein